MKTRLLIIIGIVVTFTLVFGLMAIVYEMTGMDMQTAYYYYYVKNGCTQISLEKFLPDGLDRLDANTKFLHFTENDLTYLNVIKSLISKIDLDGDNLVGMYVTEAEWNYHWNYFKNAYNIQFGKKTDESFETNFEYNGIKYIASFPIC